MSPIHSIGSSITELVTNENNNLMQIVIDTVPYAIFWKDTDGRYQGCNHYFIEHTDLVSIDEIINKTDDDIGWLPEEQHLYCIFDEEVLHQGVPMMGNVEFIMKRNGAPCWLETNKIPLKNSQGETVGILGAYIDVTERKHMHEDREAAQSFNKLLLDLNHCINTSPEMTLEDAFFIIGNKVAESLNIERVTFWQEMKQVDQQQDYLCLHTCYDIHHTSGPYKNRELFSVKHSRNYYTPLLRGNIIRAEDAHTTSETSMLLETYLVPFEVRALIEMPIHAGGEFWGSMRVERKRLPREWAVIDEQLLRSLCEIISSFINVTNNIEIAGKLRKQKQLNDKIIENLPVGLFTKDAKNDFRYTNWNREMEHIFGVKQMAFLNKKDADVFESQEADYRLGTDKQVFDADVAVNIYEDILTKDNRKLHVHIKKFPLYDEQNNPDMVIGIVNNITDLINTQQELEDYRNHLETLVEEQVHDLKEAKEYAEQANAAKSVFLANMSHELRTPMHAIMNYSQMSIDRIGEASNEKIKKYLENIHRSGDRLVSLLNDLLDLSKMEAQQMDLHFDLHDLKQTITNVIEELNSLLLNKKLKCCTNFPDGECIAEYDDTRITQVLINLFSNAIKFSGEETNIHIEVKPAILEKNQPAFSISIYDEGIGIPEDELDKVFDKFSQSSLTDSGAGGTGLGLTICREIIELHQGRIWAENNEDKGAKFTFMIPLRRSN